MDEQLAMEKAVLVAAGVVPGLVPPAADAGAAPVELVKKEAMVKSEPVVGEGGLVGWEAAAEAKEEEEEGPVARLALGQRRPSQAKQRARKSLPGAQSQRQICDECGLLFGLWRDLVEHLAVFHDPKDAARHYCCGLCGQLFHTAEERRLHDADHDAAALITLTQDSPALRGRIADPRPPLPDDPSDHPLSPSPPPDLNLHLSAALPSASSSLHQPLRLDVGDSRSPLATISAPATPHAPFSPTFTGAGSGGGPAAKRTKTSGSAPHTPSDYPVNPPPPEPSPTLPPAPAPSLGQSSEAGREVKKEAVKEPTKEPTKDTGGASGAVSRCPRCQAGFGSAWLMLDHTITRHSARLVRLERKCFDEGLAERQAEVYEDLVRCPFCGLGAAQPSAALLHIVQEHRSNTGLYQSPDWAHRVVVSAEVVYLAASTHSRELKFKINVTLKVRK